MINLINYLIYLINFQFFIFNKFLYSDGFTKTHRY